MTSNLLHRGRVAAVALATVAATGMTVLPADAAGAARYAVKVGPGCSGAVLNTRSGSWVITAKHCAATAWVGVGTRHFPVVRRVERPGSLPGSDLALVQVRGNIKAAVGGGFAVGRAPAAGSRVSVRGFPSGSDRLAGCDDLRVSYYKGYPEVHSCYLPNGTSGGPWYTSDVVLRGVVGGIDGGGRSDYITNTVPFTRDVVRWILGRIY